MASNPRDIYESKKSSLEELIETPSAIGVWLTRARLEKGYSVPELASKSGLSAVSIYNIESGKSQNPQRTTIEKLESVLDQNLSADAKEEAKEEATIDGIGEWFDFNPNRQEEWPSAAGIYVLYDISNRPIYVGQGQKISTRLKDHHDKFWFRPPEPPRVSRRLFGLSYAAMGMFSCIA